MSNYQFSFFHAPITNVTPERNFTIIDAYNYILSDEAKDRTMELRTLNSSESKLYKSTHFDYCSFSGTFSSRSANGLIKHSGLMCIDFDHVPDVSALKRKLLAHEYFVTVLMFTSPSGDGVKWIIATDVKDSQEHSRYFGAMIKCIQASGLPVPDGACRDVARACFLPHDPDVYINPILLNYSDSSDVLGLKPKKSFNPDEWFELSNKDRTHTSSSVLHDKVGYSIGSTVDDIERVVSLIETQHLDIAPTYEEWRNLGFALADCLRENGRSYFMRLSALYPNHNSQEAESQYTKCLRSTGSGITIATFFQMAKQAGIAISRPRENCFLKENIPQIPKSPNPQIPNAIDEDLERKWNLDEDDLPVFHKQVYDNLPLFLKDVVENAISPSEKDVVLLGALTTFSATLNDACGIYDERLLYPNLYLYVVGDAGAGKGALTLCRMLVDPIHNELRERTKIELQNRDDKDKRVPNLCLVIPGNSSSSAFIETLSDNNARGLIFETEADTLSQSFKTEYGNFSDVMRNAFHHDPIRICRRKDHEFREITNPKLSVVLAGTPRQVLNLIPDAENGLFSRFMFYYLKFEKMFRNVFAIDDPKRSKMMIFQKMGENYKLMWDNMRSEGKTYNISVPNKLHEEFTKHYDSLIDEGLSAVGKLFLSVVRRNALCAYRIIMVLTMIRYISDDGYILSESVGDYVCLNCTDEDFHTALDIAETLLYHSVYILRKLEDANRHSPNRKKENMNVLYNALPSSFSRTQYDQIVTQLGYNQKTCEKWIDAYMDKLLISRIGHGRYEKTINNSYN